MKKVLSLFHIIVLLCITSVAQAATWTYTFDNKGDNSAGFKNMDKNGFTGVLSLDAELNGINWNYTSDSYVASYSTGSRQAFGTTANPVTHGVLSTDGFKGKIVSVTAEARIKTTGAVVNLSVKVNGKAYGSAATLATESASYKFVPSSGMEEGKLEIIFDQDADAAVKSQINLLSLTVVYLEEGVTLKEPKLEFATKETTLTVDEGMNILPLTNPFNVSPIHYTSSDKSVAVIYQDKEVWSKGKKGEVIITAVFDGDNVYAPQEVSYKLTIVDNEPVVVSVPLKADFMSGDSKPAYYKMGWDSAEEAGTWKYYGLNVRNYWELTSLPYYADVKPFSYYDNDHVYSLSIKPDKDAQKERAVSPEIIVKPNSEAEFYACFSGVWLYNGTWKFIIKDVIENTSEELLNGFKWSQDNAFTGPAWVAFNVDLSKYSGHKCTFEFLYEGSEGSYVSIDGFKLRQTSPDGSSKISAKVGQKIHFRSTSEGEPTSYEWTFEGADVTTSTEADPVVTYSKSGEYSVKLVVRRGEESSEIVKEKVVIIEQQAPTAYIGKIEGNYYSPYVYAFVPVNTPVKLFHDSDGYPTNFEWTLPGTDLGTSNDENPVVKYLKDGKYDVMLTVSNMAGSDDDKIANAIQVGGTQDIWNISRDEYSLFSIVSLGGLGYYGGSNMLGLNAFAEHFDKPAVPAIVNGATLYFAYAASDTPDALITVSLCKAGADGLPGEILASASRKISDIKASDESLIPTIFKFDEPVDVDGEFYITVTGFPNEGVNDKVCLFSVRRQSGTRKTSYHCIEDEDDGGNGLGTYQWFNSTDFVSFALTAHLTYKDVDPTAVVAPSITTGERAIYTIDGTKVENMDKAGVYIIREGKNAKKIVIK